MVYRDKTFWKYRKVLWGLELICLFCLFIFLGYIVLLNRNLLAGFSIGILFSIGLMCFCMVSYWLFKKFKNMGGK